MKKTIFIFILFTCTLSGYAQFKNASFSISDFTLPYQIMFPENYDETKAYPLVLFLHGSGERGDDNQKQLIHGKQFMIDNFQSAYPAIVIVPQCPIWSRWANSARNQIEGNTTVKYGLTGETTRPMNALMMLVNFWLSSGKIDTSRVYVGGLSMGGMGTLEILWRLPDTFAAAFPICGGGDLDKLHLYAQNTAVWLFHGSDDSVVPPQNSRDVYKRLKELGCDAEYTEYEGVNHNSWDNAFQEKNLVPWLFKHKK